MFDVPTQIKNDYYKLHPKAAFLHIVIIFTRNGFVFILIFATNIIMILQTGVLWSTLLKNFVRKIKLPDNNPDALGSHAIRLYYKLKNIDTLNKTANQNNKVKQKSSVSLPKEKKFWP